MKRIAPLSLPGALLLLFATGCPDDTAQADGGAGLPRRDGGGGGIGVRVDGGAGGDTDGGTGGDTDGGVLEDGGGADGGGSGGFDAGPPPPFAISTRGHLIWKRHRTFENDLLSALELQKGELCNELGLFPCVDFVHLVPLGGNDPFEKAQYEPLSEPSVTTSLAVDRVVLAGCAQRVARDAAEGGGVFGALDLSLSALDASDPGTAAAVTEVITELYRRFLARDPSPEELALVRELVADEAGQPVSATEFARLACYAVGTTTEALFQ